MQLQRVDAADQGIAERKRNGRFVHHINGHRYGVYTAFGTGNNKLDVFYAGITVFPRWIINYRCIRIRIAITKIPPPGTNGPITGSGGVCKLNRF